MSPIFGHFGETLHGLLTLRAFRRQDMFTEHNYGLLNNSNRAYWAIQEVRRPLTAPCICLSCLADDSSAVRINASYGLLGPSLCACWALRGAEIACPLPLAAWCLVL